MIYPLKYIAIYFQIQVTIFMLISKASHTLRNTETLYHKARDFCLKSTFRHFLSFKDSSPNVEAVSITSCSC